MGLILFRVLSFLLKQSVKLFLTIVLLIMIPFLLVILSPVYISRLLVSHLSKYLRKDLGKMVSTLGSIMVQDDKYSKPTLNVVVGLTFEGRLSIKTIIEAFMKNVIENYSSNNELKYPELQQFPVPWLGFTFWKKDKKFNILNHIKNHDVDDDDDDGVKYYSHKDIEQLSQCLLETPWAKNSPLWDVTLVNNYIPQGFPDVPHCIVLFRFHHTLGDGYAILAMLVQALANKQIEIPKPTHGTPFKGTSICNTNYWNIWKTILFPFKSAYELSGHITNIIFDMSWKSYWNSKGGVIGEKLNFRLSDRIALKDIKSIKSENDVTFTSVIFAVVTGAIRETMIKKGLTIPKSILLSTATVMPRKDLKLRNLVTGSVLYLPLREPDALKRLQICYEEYEGVKSSSLPLLTGSVLIPMAGALFNTLVKMIGRTSIIPIGLSNFPAGFQYPTIQGLPCVDVFFTAGIALDNYGLQFCIISYEGGLRISTSTTDRLMTTDDIDNFNEDLHKQISILKNSLIV